MPATRDFSGWTVLFLGLAATAIHAADDPAAVAFNQVKKLGDVAPEWRELPTAAGGKHSLADWAQTPVVVVLFTCNSCPTARDYEDRTMALVERFERESPGKVRLAAINVNRVADDQLPAMTARAKERKFNFPYLYDESQQIARDYGAITTPQYFVLNDRRQIVYMGALDDATDPQAAKQNYVAEAVTALLAGKSPAITSEPPRGCLIRFVRERRK